MGKRFASWSAVALHRFSPAINQVSSRGFAGIRFNVSSLRYKLKLELQHPQFG
jgi:hypothetical protein